MRACAPVCVRFLFFFDVLYIPGGSTHAARCNGSKNNYHAYRGVESKEVNLITLANGVLVFVFVHEVQSECRDNEAQAEMTYFSGEWRNQLLGCLFSLSKVECKVQAWLYMVLIKVGGSDTEVLALSYCSKETFPATIALYALLCQYKVFMLNILGRHIFLHNNSEDNDFKGYCLSGRQCRST